MQYILVLFCLFAATTLNAETVLYPINGRSISFSELQGKWVFVNYWASWCGPCLDEIPELNQFYENNPKEKFALFAVNYDMLPEGMQQQVTNHYNIHYPALKKDPAHALRLGDIRGVPVTFIFNPQGKLTETLYGGQKAKQLSRFIR